MAMPSDLEIARQHISSRSLKSRRYGIEPKLLEHYGENVAKIKLDAIAELADRPKAKYVVVSAITRHRSARGRRRRSWPGQAMHYIGRSATIAIASVDGPTSASKRRLERYSQAVRWKPSTST